MASVPLKRMVPEEISRRFLPEGGIVDRPHGQFRVDATAWGILAFDASVGGQDALERHRARLIRDQGEDLGALSDGVGRGPVGRRAGER